MLRLFFLALLAASCVAVQPDTTPVPLTPVPSADTTTTPTLTPAPPQATAAPTTPTSAPTAPAEPTATVAPTATSAPTATAALPPSTTPNPIAPPPKAVFIVGPEEDLTDSNLASAEAMAVQAESAGMDVRRVFYPNATWENVLAEVQGASLVAYLGHGYGFPSNTASLTERSQDGMGLNPYDGSGLTDVKYYGATLIRENIRLAPHAVVLLMHGCYTAGNGELGTPIPTSDLARERVDNYASGWLAVGAGAVFGFQWGTRVNYAEAFMGTDSTVDLLFMDSREHVGWNDLYFDSQRTPGAVNHLDPDPNLGYLRAVTGDLAMTTAEWRSGAGQIAPAALASR